MKKVFRLLVMLVCGCLVFSNMALPAIADQLPGSELQALSEWPNWVSSTCSTAPSPTVNAGSGQPDGASFPNLDPTAMANTIDQFVQKENPNSELKGLGSIIVASAKNSNVSPFLIVAIAHEESNLADPTAPDNFNVTHANNAFGREAAPGQPQVQGSHAWYRWSSVKASVDYTAPENKNAAGGGDIATYLRDQYGGTIDSSDLVSLFLKYAPPSENNTTQYIANVKGWVNDMVNGTGSSNGTPSPNASSAGNDCACADAGTTLVGSDNQEKIFNYFVGKGLSPAQAAGIDGNFGQESGWNPSDPGGYLGQWGGGRLTALQTLAQNDGKPVTDLGVQLDYTWLELTNGPGAGEDDSKALKDLKAITGSTPQDASAAADVFSNEYERPGDPQLQNREQFATNALSNYGSSATPSSNCSSTVDCNNPAVSGLSDTRKSVVCGALAELALWQSGQMKPGFRTNSSDSFSKYSRNIDDLWCAYFASWIYNQAGYPLQSGDWLVGGVTTIQSIGEANGNFHWHDVSSSYTPQPGDLAIHGGSHVNIVTAVSGGTITLIGGDQVGPSYPEGSRVSQYIVNSPSSDGITGYVSPD